jgi:hypothetical protein
MTSNLEKMAISTRYKPMLIEPCQKPQLAENKEKHQFLLDTNSAFLLDTNQLSAHIREPRAFTTAHALTAQHASPTMKTHPNQRTDPQQPPFAGRGTRLAGH